MKKGFKFFCVKINVWLTVVKKGTNTLIFHIFESGTEYGAECSMNLVLNSIFITVFSYTIYSP